MAAIPAYLQGSQTGGILQNLASPQQSYIPAISGTQPQQYTPGYGQAPYAAPALQSYIPATSTGGMSMQMAQQILSSPSASPENKWAAQQAMERLAQNASTMSTFPSQQNQPAPQTAAPQTSNEFTVAGDPNAWMTPDQMRASTQGLQSRLSSGQSGSGGSGSNSIVPPQEQAAGSRGLNLSGVGGNAPGGATAGQLTQSSTPIGPTLGYQDPGSVNNTNTVGYINPGSSNSGGQAGVLQMQQANPQAALDQYKGTPGYQLLNAPGAYQASPGYQYAMNEALNQVQNQASARGMLESGAVLKQMQQTASGLAQQDYGNWWNRQNQLYSDYQNRLQGLAGGPTGSADAMTAGANAAQANLQTGSNLGSLFGNQGTAGMGGIINTAAAQSGNMINAGQQQASVNAANQATQLAGATLASNQQQARGLF